MEIKYSITKWSVLLAVLALFGSCHNELDEITANSTMASDIPSDVRKEIDKLQVQYPEARFIAMEMNEEGKIKVEELRVKYGAFDQIRMISSSDDGRNFGILEWNDQVKKLADATRADGDVFLIVEESAHPERGLTAFYEFIQMNLNYPSEARNAGIQGKVFVEFIINTDGTISDVKVVKSIGGGCGEEAIRIMEMAPLWTPGKNRGIPVRQKMVLPITFQLG